jgi:hypothetical protein
LRGPSHRLRRPSTPPRQSRVVPQFEMTCERTIRQVTIFTRNGRVGCPFVTAPHPVCGRGTKPRGRLRVGLSPYTPTRSHCDFETPDKLVSRMAELLTKRQATGIGGAPLYLRHVSNRPTR